MATIGGGKWPILSVLSAVALISINRRTFRWVGCIAATGLAIAVGTTWWISGQLIAAAPRSIGPSPSDFRAEAIEIPSDSGSRLSGWYVRGDVNKGTVVLLHAIRACRLQMVDRARLLSRHGYSALLIDLQAHGESPGEYITAGHLERLDVEAAVRFARKYKPEQPVAVIGVSLGGAATLLASPLNVDAVILESVYPTIGEAIDNRVRMRLGSLSPIATRLLLWQLKPRLGISPTQLRPIDHIADIGCPVLIMGGKQDKHTLPTETTRFYQAALEPKQLALIDGAAHVDLYRFNCQLYSDLVLGFLKTHLDRD